MSRFTEEIEKIQLRMAQALEAEAVHKAERARLEAEKARIELRTAQRIDEVAAGEAKRLTLPDFNTGGGKA